MYSFGGFTDLANSPLNLALQCTCIYSIRLLLLMHCVNYLNSIFHRRKLFSVSHFIFNSFLKKSCVYVLVLLHKDHLKPDNKIFWTEVLVNFYWVQHQNQIQWHTICVTISWSLHFILHILFCMFQNLGTRHASHHAVTKPLVHHAVTTLSHRAVTTTLSSQVKPGDQQNQTALHQKQHGTRWS